MNIENSNQGDPANDSLTIDDNFSVKIEITESEENQEPMTEEDTDTDTKTDANGNGNGDNYFDIEKASICMDCDPKKILYSTEDISNHFRDYSGHFLIDPLTNFNKFKLKLKRLQIKKLPDYYPNPKRQRLDHEEEEEEEESNE